MSAIIATDVVKRFRRVNMRGGYTTIKSLLLNTFKAPSSPAAPTDSYFEALGGVDLEIPKGSTWGIIGANGSGKSTLLKLIAGIYKPDRGTILVDGRVSALIELGAGFHPEFSGRENVFINASILGMSKKLIREKFDEIVSFAELEDFIDNPVRTYSSGMFMRLGFSVAIHSDPDILLVDEVLAVGDEAFSHKCKGKTHEFKKAGKTIVVVTHSMADIQELCESAVWLENGKIRQIGSPKRIIDSYLTTVAELENKILLDKDHTGKPADNGQTNRWGTGEVEITKVTMRTGSGEERYVYQSGDAVVIEVEYTANTLLEDPVIGLGIHKQNGAHCYGTNTVIEGIRIDEIDGPGKVTMKFDRLDLVEDKYTLSVAIHARDGHPYDYHDQMYGFTIRSSIKDVGVFRPPHQWSFNGGTSAVTYSGADE